MKSFLKEPMLQALFATALAALFLALFFASYWLNPSDKFLILHFDVYRGIDLFGSIDMLYELLSFGVFVVLANYFLGSVLYVRARFFSYVVATATLFFSVLLFIAVSVIILVN